MLITVEELVRGGIVVVFGGAAGTAAMLAPGSALWVIPAAIGAACGAATVPEVRRELRALAPVVRRALPAPAGLGDDLRLLARLPMREKARFLATGELPAQPRQLADAHSSQRPARPPLAAPADALPTTAWLHAVNDRPDDNPHLTVVGPSGSGKTTFVSAALAARPGRKVVLTPKVSPRAWRDAEVITLNDDLSYEPIAQALDTLLLEARARAKKLQRGEPLEPMTVVLDELPELHAEVPGLGKFAVRLSRWGRELGMRQVVIATSDDALNIPGWAATRPNYARVELHKPTPDGARPAWLDDGQSRRPLDLRGLTPPRPAASATGTTQLVRRPALDMPELLDSLLADPLPAHQDAEVTPADGVTVTSNGNGTARSSVRVSNGNGGVTVNVAQVAGGGRRGTKGKGIDVHARRLRGLYRRAGAEGVAFRKAYEQHGGSRNEMHAAWQEGRKTREGK